MADIQICTLHDPEGKPHEVADYWIAWADGVQGDGSTEADAIANAKARVAAGEVPERAHHPR